MEAALKTLGHSAYDTKAADCGCVSAGVAGMLGIGAAGTYLSLVPAADSPLLHGAAAFALVAVFTAAGKRFGRRTRAKGHRP